MSAILGWINNEESLIEKENAFKQMMNLMSFRGNEKTGYHLGKNVLLGSKRLAIRDLEKGNQPMYYKEYVLVYNGEIFNADEIREKLKQNGYMFDTNCDTEVVLKGYAEFKEKIVEMLEGFFAFGIYNSKTNELFLARDRFGIKPLYYSMKNNNFIFSSMINPIIKSGIIKPHLSKVALGEILALGPSKKQGSRYFH